MKIIGENLALRARKELAFYISLLKSSTYYWMLLLGRTPCFLLGGAAPKAPY
jgi:hypothetical protein